MKQDDSTLFNRLLWIGGFLGFRWVPRKCLHISPPPKAAARFMGSEKNKNSKANAFCPWKMDAYHGEFCSFPDWTCLKKNSPARKNMTCEVEALPKKNANSCLLSLTTRTWLWFLAVDILRGVCSWSGWQTLCSSLLQGSFRQWLCTWRLGHAEGALNGRGPWNNHTMSVIYEIM